MSVSYENAALTDVGNIRTVNEDSFSFADYTSIDKGIAFLVSDGMGGYTGGDVASQFVSENILSNLESIQARNMEDLIERSVLTCNDELLELSVSNGKNSLMGATLALLIINGYNGYVCNIGDSRVYLIRDNNIVQISDDHTVVAEMEKSGLIKHEEALTHPKKHMLSKVLGRELYWEEDFIKKFPVLAEDRFVICSDGLYNYLDNKEIFEISLACNSEESGQRMLNLAKERGGSDNITVQVVKINNIEED